jgi:hypothetical protein
MMTTMMMIGLQIPSFEDVPFGYSYTSTTALPLNAMMRLMMVVMMMTTTREVMLLM